MNQASANIDHASTRGVTSEDGSSLARFERAALSLFTTNSIDATTTKQIAAAAGLSEGLLYRYSPSKKALAESMFFVIHARLAGMVREAGKTGNTIDEKTAAIVNAYIQCAEDDWTLFSYHLQNTHRFLHEDASLDNPVAATEEIIYEAMETGEIPKGDVTLISAMALGIILQPALHKVFGRITDKLNTYAPEITRSIISLLHQR